MMAGSDMARDILRSFAPATGTVEEGAAILRDALNAARDRPDDAASVLVSELAAALGVSEMSQSERMARAVIALWSSARAGQEIDAGISRAMIVAQAYPDLPAAELVREFATAIDVSPGDAQVGRNPMTILREAIEAALPGAGRLADAGWTLSEGTYRPKTAGVGALQIRPGIWAFRGVGAAIAPVSPSLRNGIYMASKATAHGPTWQRLREEGWPIISTWIDESAPGLTLDWPDLWERCLREVTSAEVCIVYMEPGETLKGAWVEVGAALAAGVPVIGVGIEEFSIQKSGKIIEAESLDEALQVARGIMDGNTHISVDPEAEPAL